LLTKQFIMQMRLRLNLQVNRTPPPPPPYSDLLLFPSFFSKSPSFT
jgi:hypothetical protein